MASEKHLRRRNRSAIRRAWLFCLFLSLPAFVFTAIFLYQARISLSTALLLVACLLIYLLLVAGALIEGTMRPLQTLSNVVASLREGDYSFRARGAGGQDALGELADPGGPAVENAQAAGDDGQFGHAEDGEDPNQKEVAVGFLPDFLAQQRGLQVGENSGGIHRIGLLDCWMVG